MSPTTVFRSMMSCMPVAGGSHRGHHRARALRVSPAPRSNSALRGSPGLRNDSGQSLVELALIVPLFTLLLAGAVEFGELAYAAIEVSNAARAGVAYGSQSVTTAADTLGMQTAAQNDAADINGLTATANTFCSCSNAAATPVSPCSSAPATCAASNARVLNYVEVTTSATINPLAHLVGATSFTLNGQAIMRVQQ